MKVKTLLRKELYEKVWSSPALDICRIYDISEEGLESICRRLNVPFPQKTHWQKIANAKKTIEEALPEKSYGTETVDLYLRDDQGFMLKRANRIQSLLDTINPGLTEKLDLTFDKLIESTREGIYKDWQQREKYKILSVHVSPEKLARALFIMDLLIKVLRCKGHALIVEQHQTFAVLDSEKIQISLREKNRRVEYLNQYQYKTSDNHPTGVLYFKKEGSSFKARQWSEGPKKGQLEDQLLVIVEDLAEIAREQKEQKMQWEKQRLEQVERDRLRHEFQERQRRELAMFRQLLYDAHRHWQSAIVREYINQIEANAS
ncbi:MAG TPA: hypothetical protein VGD40_02245 [Chryseosolibacter sp.]